MKTSRVVLGVLLALPLFWPAVASGKDKPKVEIVESDIYYGDPTSFRSPATVDVDSVYGQIPEYREIVDRGLTESDARYLILLRAASDRFRAAINAAAAEGGYDLIGGLGSIRIEGREIPEITQLVIRKLPR